MTQAVPPVPALVARRGWWVLAVLVWGGIVSGSLYRHFDEAETQSVQIALEGARNMFQMVVLTRAWNAEHGGVYLPVSDTLQPNPYLEHPRRDLVTTDGQRLTLVNPAFMTRLLSELANRDYDTTFHITSLRPIRPANAPDRWESEALTRFEAGEREAVAVLPAATSDTRQLRYMAPLLVTASCLGCHAKQGYKEGDIRGGISVTVPFAPVEAALRPAKRQSMLNHLAIFLLGSAGGLLLLELLRRRWLHLGETIGALQAAHAQLDESNRALREARDAAEAASAAKSQFLANMSHELRTPLNAISGFSHVLRRRAADHEMLDKIGQIQKASDKLLNMINQLLCLARVETGQLEHLEEPFELAQLVDELYEALEHAIEGKPLLSSHLLFAREAMPLWLRGDRRHVAQIVGHYIDNAVKFSERGPIILKVEYGPTDGGTVRLRFDVIDQGIGIAPEAQAELFSLFHQVDASTTRNHGGTGIGLILCKRLAQLLDGEVGVSSEAGKGSDFWLEVPMAPCEPRILLTS